MHTTDRSYWARLLVRLLLVSRRYPLAYCTIVYLTRRSSRWVWVPMMRLMTSIPFSLGLTKLSSLNNVSEKGRPGQSRGQLAVSLEYLVLVLYLDV